MKSRHQWPLAHLVQFKPAAKHLHTQSELSSEQMKCQKILNAPPKVPCDMAIWPAICVVRVHSVSPGDGQPHSPARFPLQECYEIWLFCMWCSWTLYGENLIKIDPFKINMGKLCAWMNEAL